MSSIGNLVLYVWTWEDVVKCTNGVERGIWGSGSGFSTILDYFRTPTGKGLTTVNLFQRKESDVERRLKTVTRRSSV